MRYELVNPETMAVEGVDGGDGSFADELIDDLLPAEFDWRRMVRRYPIPAIAVAAVGGYLLGRSQGRALLSALAAYAASEIAAEVEDLATDEGL